MATFPDIRIQRKDFDINAEIIKATRNNPDIGAVVTFSGICRSESETLSALELEHYPGMAEAEIERIAQTAIKRFGLSALSAIHRHGKIAPGENIVLVIACSTHRQAAFDGAGFVMDFLKTRAPFWKKEHLHDGETGKWIDAKDRDDAALDKWDKAPKGV